MLSRRFLVPGASLLFWMVCIAVPQGLMAQPSPQSLAAFDAYVHSVETRLQEQHESAETFLDATAFSPGSRARMHRSEQIIEQLNPPGSDELPGAILHHWRGTAFVAGGKVADFDRLMKSFDAYPQRFSPQVIEARVLTGHGNRFQACFRVRQRHVITVVMDTTYDISFGRLDKEHGYSTSKSTRISEVSSAGTAAERTLNPSEEHGFLWRMNTYWSYEERDGGLYMQVESVSLTRSIPRGLGWAVGPYVESVPREALEFTLRAVCAAL